MGLKIGILLPRSDMFPTLARDFLNGLKLSLHSLNTTKLAPKFIVEGVGTASDDTLVRTAEKMLLQEEVDLTISFCSIYKLDELIGVFNAYKKPLIHIDLGGNIVKQQHISEHVLFHTLNLWQSAYTAGVYAAKNYGKSCMVASSFYEGGYQLTESFVKGFTDTGGTITNYFVASMDYKTETYEALIKGVQETEPDFIFTLFSYKEGVKVFDILSKSELNGKTPVMALPLMTDETINTENYEMKDVTSIASWSFDDDTPQMKTFINVLKEQYDELPNIMSLLGYEIGQIVAEALNATDGIPAKLSEYFKNKTIDSPRGTLTFNTYNESQVDSFKIRKFNFNKIRYHNSVIGIIDTSSMGDLHSKFQSSPYSGWQNPYICT